MYVAARNTMQHNAMLCIVCHRTGTDTDTGHWAGCVVWSVGCVTRGGRFERTRSVYALQETCRQLLLLGEEIAVHSNGDDGERHRTARFGTTLQHCSTAWHDC